MSKPNPVSAPRATDLKQVSRKVLCNHYESCLDNAVVEKWKGFTCESCNAYRISDWSKGQWMEDAYKCAALAIAVIYPEFYEQSTC